MLTLDSPMYKGVQGGVFAIKRGKWSLEWLERVWGMWRVLGPKRQYSDRFAMQARAGCVCAWGEGGGRCRRVR